MPVTASDGIHETVVTEPSIRMTSPKSSVDGPNATRATDVITWGSPESCRGVCTPREWAVFTGTQVFEGVARAGFMDGREVGVLAPRMTAGIPACHQVRF